MADVPLRTAMRATSLDPQDLAARIEQLERAVAKIYQALTQRPMRPIYSAYGAKVGERIDADVVLGLVGNAYAEVAAIHQVLAALDQRPKGGDHG
jgi:hypothetical protein